MYRLQTAYFMLAELIHTVTLLVSFTPVPSCGFFDKLIDHRSPETKTPKRKSKVFVSNSYLAISINIFSIYLDLSFVLHTVIVQIQSQVIAEENHVPPAQIFHPNKDSK